MNRLGIESLTVLGMPPVEHVKLAAELGCVSVSLGLGRLPIGAMGYPDLDGLFQPWTLVDNPALVRQVKAVLADTGVHVALGEGMRVAPDLDVERFASQLDVHTELGTRRINAICTEHDKTRALDQFDKLASMVIERDMAFFVEFAPPHAVNSLATAKAVADALGDDRCAMMVDAMHFFRSGARVEEIAQFPIRYAQLCDAALVGQPGKSYLQEACFERLVPGAGELPLREWIAALPAGCGIGIEVPNAAVFARGVTPRAYCAQAVAAARALGA